MVLKKVKCWLHDGCEGKVRSGSGGAYWDTKGLENFFSSTGSLSMIPSTQWLGLNAIGRVYVGMIGEKISTVLW